MQNFFIDTDSFIIHVKTEDIYKDFGRDIGKKFGISNFKLGKTLPKMKKSNQINEREIKRKTHEKKFVGLRAKSYSYLIHDDREDEKGKDTKKCVIERNVNLKIIKTVQKHLKLKIK